MMERISEITQRWFLSEEALFMTFCTHHIEEQRNMRCPIRVGKGIIEVNPDLCDAMSDSELEERLRVEVIRILLKHPYDRQPEGCSNVARALGSNCVVGDNYPSLQIKIEHPSDFNLAKNGHYEFYARRIQKMLKNQDSKNESNGEEGNNTDDEDDSEGGNGDNQTSNSGNNKADGNGLSNAAGDAAENWEQDELMTAQINETIRSTNSWGSLPGNIVEQIIASTKARIDYRKILAGFRASIISQARRLTRMRPNRRSGFEAMGSRYDFTTSMIVGVDVSGSISKEDLENFYTTINRFFRYGIQRIDVVQFDTKLGEVQTIEKAAEEIKIEGRGGTDFQPFVDFVAGHPEYDGALIYTDGYANKPIIPDNMQTPLCWVLSSEENLKVHEEWMSKIGRVCVIENIK